MNVGWLNGKKMRAARNEITKLYDNLSRARANGWAACQIQLSFSLLERRWCHEAVRAAATCFGRFGF